MTGNIITQLSIFVNNEPGRLAYISSVIKDCQINIRAFNLAESSEFGILRAIVDSPEQAFESLRSKGVIVKKTSVIGIIMNDEPGALFTAAGAVGKAGINIDYGYAYADAGKAVFYIRVDDPEKAIDILKAQGLELIESE